MTPHAPTLAPAAASTGAMAIIAALFEARTGQHLAANRSWRLDTALKPLLRERGLASADALVAQLLDGRDDRVGDRMVELLLNHETSFFRDASVIEGVVDAVLAGEPHSGRRRIWSAGCSFGQEPLSLAMLFAERLEGSSEAVPEIVGTDWSGAAIERARHARFTQFEIQRGLPVRRMVRWFEGAGDEWTARPDLRRMVSFRRHNLIADPAPAGLFDAVSCRNVLFYLTPVHRAAVLAKIAAALRPGGVLVLGAGETVLGQGDLFEPSRRCRGLYEPVATPARRRTG